MDLTAGLKSSTLKWKGLQSSFYTHGQPGGSKKICFLVEMGKKCYQIELRPQYLLYCYKSLQVSTVSDCSIVLLCIYVLYCISEINCYGFTRI